MPDEMKRLDTLAYLDQETVRIYDAVLAKAGEDVKAQLQQYRDQHETHVQHWSDIAGRIEWSRQGPSEDMKMMLDEHLRLAQETTDQDHALEALLLVERMNLAELRKASKEQQPQEAADMVKQHFEQEQQHVTYIEQKMPALTGINFAAHDAPTT